MNVNRAINACGENVRPQKSGAVSNKQEGGNYKPTVPPMGILLTRRNWRNW